MSDTQEAQPADADAEQQQPERQENDLELSPDRAHQQSNMDLFGSQQKKYEQGRELDRQNQQEELGSGELAEQMRSIEQEEQAQLEHETQHLPSIPHDDQEIHRHEQQHPLVSSEHLPDIHKHENDQQALEAPHPIHELPATNVHASLPSILPHTPPEEQPTHEDAENISRLEQYLQHNHTAIQSILDTEFNASVTLDRESLFAALVHILSIEPIEITSADQNILYAHGYGEPRLQELFSWFREEDSVPEDQAIHQQDIHRFLKFVVQREHLQVAYTFKRKNKTALGHSSPSPRNASLNLKEELKETRHRYQHLQSERGVSDPQKKLIGEMIANIDMQLRDPQLKESARTNGGPILSAVPYSTAQAIETIFEHYCKQSYATGKNATFDRIKHESNILNMNKFMMFCRDFSIIAGSRHQADRVELVKMVDLVEIFKKNSANYKEMSLEQFQQALAKVGERMFPEADQKQDALYAYLAINNQASFRQQVKRLKIPYIFRDGRKITKPTGYKIHTLAHQKPQGELKGSAKSVGKHTAELQKRGLLEGGENRGSVQNLLGGQLRPIKLSNIPKRQELTRPPMLPLPKKPNRLTMDTDQNKSSNNSRAKITQKALTPLPPGIETPIIPTSNSSQRQLTIPTGTRYSQIHAIKKRGLTVAVPSSAEDKKQYKLNNIVSDARNLVSEANNYKDTSSMDKPMRLDRYQTREERVSLDNLVDDGEEDEYLTKHWQLEKNMSHNDINLKINQKLQQIRQEEVGKERATSMAGNIALNRPSGRLAAKGNN